MMTDIRTIEIETGRGRGWIEVEVALVMTDIAHILTSNPRGFSAVVRECTERATGKVFAVKIINLANHQVTTEAVQREMAVMKQVWLHYVECTE